MKLLRISSFAALAAAGILHLMAAPEHIEHMTVHGLFLLLLGAAQVTWALVWLRWRTRPMILGGLALSGGIVLLWTLLLLVPSPFIGHLALHARTPDWAAIATKIAETIGAGALLAILVRTEEGGGASWRRRIAPGALAVMLTTGLGLWLIAVSIETIFPVLSISAGWPTPQLVASFFAPPSQEQTVSADTPTFDWQLPAGFPVPRIPVNDPMTTEKIALGRYLFYDTRLSGNGTQSCSSCHLQTLAFSDGKVTPVGSTGEPLLRNSPALVNVAYNATLTWANPALTEIERQVLVPLFGEFPVEMGVTGHETAVLARLSADALYQQLFAAAFPDDEKAINYHNITQALASFIRSLISGNSAYDRYVAGDRAALSPAAVRGMELFFSERFECHHCHTGFNFTASTVHANSTFATSNFQNNGLYNLDEQGAYPTGNRGVYEITGNPNDMGRFRPPSLRNVALTAPYMHDGSIPTLEAVVRHYAAGGRDISDGPYQGDGRRNPIKSTLVTGFTITDQEVADLVSFLTSLTDTDFITNPAYADPFAANSTDG